MMNFRYHVVSLVAAFLALGTGVLIGSSFISEGTVEVLRRNLRSLEESNDRLTAEVESLEASGTALEEFTRETKPLVVRDKLRNRAVVLVSFEMTPEEVVDSLAETLRQSGARVDGAVRLSEKLDLATEVRREQLALALETSDKDATRLRGLLVERLFQSLSGGGGGGVAKLVEAELASLRQSPGILTLPPEALASPGSAVVILGLPEESSDDLELELLLPLARALGSRAVTAVCDGTRDEGFLSTLRRDSSLRIVTVDGIEGAVGQAGLALGLAAAFEGRFGHYGTGEGAASVLPASGGDGNR